MEKTIIDLLECSPIAQFAIGLDHRIILWNKACELLTGHPAATMVGTDRQWEPFYQKQRPVLADLLIADDYQTFLQLYKGKSPGRSAVVPHAWEASDFFPDLGGKPRHIYFLAAPMVSGDAKLIGAVETLQDVSEQRQRAMGMQQESEKLRQENLALKSTIRERYRLGDIIGKSRVMQEVYELILQAAAASTNVIIYGESGTGKELVARAIHNLSSRRDHELVAVNCSAIPETLLESEFFGYKKGAFTGANYDKHGYLDLADRGTLFLDEVGDISLNMQVKLLRAIDGQGYSPLGSNRSKNPDVRIIAATNRNLMELVRQGQVREDFFYRIHVIPIHLPPLRERKEDLPLLIDHLMKSYDDKRLPQITGNVLERLLRYPWPGNIRELQNVLHRYVTLRRLDFPESPTGAALPPLPDQTAAPAGIHLQVALAAYEKELLHEALEQNHWQKNKTALQLGISRKTLFRKMKYFRLG